MGCYAILLALAMLAAEPKAVIEGPTSIPMGGSVLLDGRLSKSDRPLKWKVLNSKLLFVTFDKDDRKDVVVFAPSAPSGMYLFALVAVGVSEDKEVEVEVDVAVHQIFVGGVPPAPIPPGPIPPLPPGPIPPPVPPSPIPPAPIPTAGYRCLILYESADLSRLPAPQLSVLYAKKIRDFLNSKAPLGPDGKTHEWRIFDVDVDASGESPVWQGAMKLPHTSLPWIIVSNPGKGGYSGPLPANVDETLKLLAQYSD